MSKIEWTGITWNPVTGCVKISTGCKNCYAERFAKRLKAMGNKKYSAGFSPVAHLQEKYMCEPFRWKMPCTIFVCSMSDLFQTGVSDEFIEKIFFVAKYNSRHTFQFLTKRSKRLLDFSLHHDNFWVGVSVENQKNIRRIEHLKMSNANLRFISFEPLLSPIDVDLTGIDWVILGCESGPGARPIKIEWVREIRDQCIEKKIPFFLKQLNFVRKKKNRILDGREWNEMPRRS